MGEFLYGKFLDEEVENLQEVLTAHGAIGLLSAFEIWLRSKGHVRDEKKEESSKED